MLSIILSVVLQAIRITFLIILFIYFFVWFVKFFIFFFSFNFILVVVSEQVFELYLHVRQIQNTRYKTQNPQAACLSFCLYLFSFAFVFAVVVVFVVVVLALHTGELLKFYVNVHNYFKLNSKFVVCNETNSEKYVD